MKFFSRYLPFVAAMALVVVASNVLVQFPMQGTVGGLALADLGGVMLSSQIASADLGGGYRKVSLLIRAQLGEEQLMAFLEQTRTVRPIVIVEALDVRTIAAPANALALDVTATLTTFYADDHAA